MRIKEMDRDILVDYIATSDDTCIASNEEFRDIKNIEDNNRYDLYKILNDAHNFHNGLILDKLGEHRRDDKTIACYMGKEYQLRNGSKPDMPIISTEEIVGSFGIDSVHKKILYGIYGSANARDSYRPRSAGISISTKNTVEDIVRCLMTNGYSLQQVAPLHNPLLWKTNQNRINIMVGLSALFSEITGYSDRLAYVVQGDISLIDIIQNKKLPIQDWSSEPENSIKDQVYTMRQK